MRAESLLVTQVELTAYALRLTLQNHNVDFARDERAGVVTIRPMVDLLAELGGHGHMAGGMGPESVRSWLRSSLGANPSVAFQSDRLEPAVSTGKHARRGATAAERARVRAPFDAPRRSFAITASAPTEEDRGTARVTPSGPEWLRSWLRRGGVVAQY